MTIVTEFTVAPATTVPFMLRRFTVDEYHQLSAAGILTEEDRVELLEGYLAKKIVHNPPHDLSIELVDDAIRRHLPSEWRIRIQSSVTTIDSEPEPDLVVVRGSARDRSGRHPAPGEITLIVEVADTSLERDRLKCRIYGRAGIAVYWIVNLVDRCVEVYTEPASDVDDPRYGQKNVYEAEASVPLWVSGELLSSLPVTDLLP